jgi:hypothetical protein
MLKEPASGLAPEAQQLTCISWSACSCPCWCSSILAHYTRCCLSLSGTCAHTAILGDTSGLGPSSSSESSSGYSSRLMLLPSTVLGLPLASLSHPAAAEGPQSLLVLLLLPVLGRGPGSAQPGTAASTDAWDAADNNAAAAGGWGCGMTMSGG